MKKISAQPKIQPNKKQRFEKEKHETTLPKNNSPGKKNVSLPSANQEIDIREFDDMTLQLQQKISISEWQNSLIN